jgi:hypothetical protein
MKSDKIIQSLLTPSKAMDGKELVEIANSLIPRLQSMTTVASDEELLYFREILFQAYNFLREVCARRGILKTQQQLEEMKKSPSRPSKQKPTNKEKKALQALLALGLSENQALKLIKGE